MKNKNIHQIILQSFAIFCKLLNFAKILYAMNMQNRTKHRLIEARKKTGYSQEYISGILGMDVSSYSRRENGQIKISYREWQKLSEILDSPLEDIYESDDGMTLIFNDNSSGNGNIVTNYTIPQSMLDTQRKYVEKLEEEIRNLKEEIKLLRDN